MMENLTAYTKSFQQLPSSVIKNIFSKRLYNSPLLPLFCNKTDQVFITLGQSSTTANNEVVLLYQSGVNHCIHKVWDFQVQMTDLLQHGVT